jgi:phage terminase small subunit
MRAGRKPIATELHKLRGTFRATRHRARDGEPQPNGRLSAVPPKWMTELQGQYWTAAVEGAPPDLLRVIDGATLAIYAVAAALHQQATEDAAGARLLRAIGELGFSPSSRPKLSPGATDKAETESAKFWQQFRHLPGNAP